MEKSLIETFIEMFKKGGGIHINPKNKGKFTASAKRAGMSVQEFARHVLANKDKYSSTQIKRANFAKNAKKFKHQDGGQLFPKKFWFGGLFDNIERTTSYNPFSRENMTAKAASPIVEEGLFDLNTAKKAVMYNDPAARKQLEQANKSAAKNSINGAMMVAGYFNPYGIIGDLGISTVGTLADSSVEGNFDHFDKNLANNFLYDIVGHGAGDMIQTVKQYKNGDFGNLHFYYGGNQGPTLSELQDEFYNAADDTYKYVTDAIQNNRAKADALKNTRYTKVQETVPTEMFTRNNMRHKSDLDHTYRFRKNMDTGQTEVDINTFSGRNMTYAGTRAGSELALMKHLKSSYSNSMYLPEELRMIFKDNNNITNMSRLISLKRMAGINRHFSKLTDSEIRDLIQRGYATGMFSVRKVGGIPESVEEVVRRVSPIIKKYSHLIPSVIGGSLLLNEHTNEKGDQ